MKKLILAFALLTSTAIFAETETGVHTVFSRISSADAEAKMMDVVEAIKSRRIRLQNCNSRNAKVYGAGVNGMSYRVNRHGELQKQWSAYVKYRCN